jgi:hypothetical protein
VNPDKFTAADVVRFQTERSTLPPGEISRRLNLWCRAVDFTVSIVGLDKWFTRMGQPHLRAYLVANNLEDIPDQKKVETVRNIAITYARQLPDGYASIRWGNDKTRRGKNRPEGPKEEGPEQRPAGQTEDSWYLSLTRLDGIEEEQRAQGRALDKFKTDVTKELIPMLAQWARMESHLAAIHVPVKHIHVDRTPGVWHTHRSFNPFTAIWRRLKGFWRGVD